MENKDQNIFVKVFAKLLEFLKTKNVSQENENEALIEFALSKDDDAEHKDNPDPLTAEDILQLCKSIDLTNETIHEWYEQGQPDATEFGVNKIKELVHEIDPEISDAEIEDGIDEVIDQEVIKEARKMADDIAGEENALTDEEVNEIINETENEED